MATSDNLIIRSDMSSRDRIGLVAGNRCGGSAGHAERSEANRTIVLAGPDRGDWICARLADSNKKVTIPGTVPDGGLAASSIASVETTALNDAEVAISDDTIATFEDTGRQTFAQLPAGVSDIDVSSASLDITPVNDAQVATPKDLTATPEGTGRQSNSARLPAGVTDIRQQSSSIADPPVPSNRSTHAVFADCDRTGTQSSFDDAETECPIRPQFASREYAHCIV